MFFAVLGWLILMLLALGFTLGGPAAVLISTAFSGGKNWPAIIPFGVGCGLIWALCHYAPFHISFA